jgi:hypothetical protein
MGAAGGGVVTTVSVVDVSEVEPPPQEYVSAVTAIKPRVNDLISFIIYRLMVI